MNRALLFVAVATALAAPTVALAEATLYGKLHVSLDYVDVDRNAFWPGLPGTTNPPRPNAANPNFGQALSGLTTNANNDFLPRINPTTGAIIANGGVAQPSTRPYNDFPGAMALRQGVSDNFVVSDPTASQAIVGSQITAPVVYSNGTAYAFVRPDGVAEQRTADFNTNVYDTVRASETNRLAAAGVAPGVAAQVATNQALFAAYQLASPDQRAEVARQVGIATGGQAFNGWGLNTTSRGSRIGVKGSEDLGGGLKAIYQVELGIDMTNENRDTDLFNGNRGRGFAFRNTFVGLKGKWGTVLVGRHDTPMKVATGKLDQFTDSLADLKFAPGLQGLRADNIVMYLSPSISGFSLTAAVMPPGGATAPGNVYNTDADSISSAYSLAGVYSNGPLYGFVAYENLGADLWGNSNPLMGLGFSQTDTASLYRAFYGSGLEDDTKLRIGLGLLDWQGLFLAGIYDWHENINGTPQNADANTWQIQAGYAFGNSKVKGMYGEVDADPCVAPFQLSCSSGIPGLRNADKSTWALGLEHNFSKRTQLYAFYMALDDDYPDASWSGLSLGMIHAF